MENKSFTRENLSVKSEGTNLYLEGYAAVYGNVDSYKDIIQAGAFDAFLLSEEAKRVKFCFNHDIYKVIGVVEELKSDEKGLWFRAKLSNTSLGKDVAVLIEDGALSEFSIGYRTEDSIYKVAPHAGAWIETVWWQCLRYKRKSHPMRVRGLKQNNIVYRFRDLPGRTPCGCVD